MRVARRNHDPDAWQDAVGRLRDAGGEAQGRIIGQMSSEAALAFDADFEAWAHKNQLPPNGEGWRVWLMMAGRGVGKTRAGGEWIHKLATQPAGVRIALVGGTNPETRPDMNGGGD